MKTYALAGVIALSGLPVSVRACGPFFPDLVIDKAGQAFGLPPVSYLTELYQLAGKTQPVVVSSSGGDKKGLVAQIPLELAELRGILDSIGLPSETIANRLSKYESVRTAQLSRVSASEMMEFKMDASVDLPVRPLDNDFPPAIADYVEAVRLLGMGNTDEARALWKHILDLAPEQRRLRAAWAAWMLAKTSTDLTECLAWYQRVESEVAAGATDILNLGAAAKGWRASIEKNPATALRLYFQCFAAGKMEVAIDVRNNSSKLLDQGSPADLTAAAADPVLRRLVNLQIYACIDRDAQNAGSGEVDGELAGMLSQWLTALESSPADSDPDSAKIAWVLYGAGRYDEARKWLQHAAPDEAKAKWLQAKFDLRDGKLDPAGDTLSQVVSVESSKPGWHPENGQEWLRWYEEGDERTEASQGFLLADAAVVALARRKYTDALEMLRHGEYPTDADYIAERVLSTKELIAHVRKVAPAWSEEEWLKADCESYPALPDPSQWLTDAAQHFAHDCGINNQLRYLLAKRLAREKRFDDATEFMPPWLMPLWHHYVTLDRARRSGRYHGEALAAITWREALLHRRYGEDLFSTEGFPDGAQQGLSFQSADLAFYRSRPNGAISMTEEAGVITEGPPSESGLTFISSDEIARVQHGPNFPAKRFHYRYVAADLAMKAARELPRNHPLLARLYNTAGRWIAANDPEAADPFYQAMVKRCSQTQAGRDAETKRWFLADLEPLGELPLLPSKLRPAKP